MWGDGGGIDSSYMLAGAGVGVGIDANVLLREEVIPLPQSPNCKVMASRMIEASS